MDKLTQDNLEYFKEIIQKYPVKERYENILIQMQDLLEAMGIMDEVEINTELLGQAVLDYFEDIDRIKKYENIERVNVDKIYGYGTYWLLRSKPIQLLGHNTKPELLHINEKVFSAILVIKMLREAGVSVYTQNDKLESFIELLYYNFKYRTYTKKTLELMVSAFLTGCSSKNI